MVNAVKVPPLGESVTEATVAKWLKKVGEMVKADETLLELETDKVTLEVNAPVTGVLTSVSAAEGATVGVGDLLGELDASATASAPQAAAAPAPGKNARGKRCRGSARLPRSASVSPTSRRGRCGVPPVHPGVPATARDGCRACSAPVRGFRRRSPFGPPTASPARIRNRATRPAIPGG